jgi:hypothetical protein
MPGRLKEARVKFATIDDTRGWTSIDVSVIGRFHFTQKDGLRPAPYPTGGYKRSG